MLYKLPDIHWNQSGEGQIISLFGGSRRQPKAQCITAKHPLDVGHRLICYLDNLLAELQFSKIQHMVDCASIYWFRGAFWEGISMHVCSNGAQFLLLVLGNS